jgi:hypothetical protein
LGKLSWSNNRRRGFGGGDEGMRRIISDITFILGKYLP